MNKKQRVLFDAEKISKRVEELGKEITSDYAGKDIIVISLLRGSFVFAADLVRSIQVPVNIDFMITSSYGHEEVSSGKVDIIADIRVDVENKHVLIVDDIMDSGYTMSKVVDYIAKKNPESIKVCVMLDKPSRRKVNISPDYVGFIIPDVFIVGYGLDYGDYYRNTPYIFTFDD